MEIIQRNDSDNKEKLELVRLLESRECQLLKTGYKTQLMTYFFCPCDPDQKEPMCEDCYNICHAEHVKKAVISYDINAICYCGTNCHRITSDLNDSENSVQNRCLFMEWSEATKTNVYYQHNQSEEIFCMFCANFCENVANLTKKTFTTDMEIECACKADAHQEVKGVYKKLVMLRDLANLDFEYFLPTHIVNMITGSSDSFENAFYSLTQYLGEIKHGIETDPNYNMDPNIGYSAAMKALETFSVLADSCSSFNYFNDCLDLLLNRKFVFTLLEKKFDYKSGKNLWNMKYHVINLYHKFIVKRDFESIQSLSIKDIENLNPLQRLLYVRTIESQGDLYQHYFGNLKFHPLESTISIIERLNSLKEKHEVVYEILTKCYDICLVYANFNQFTKEQIMRFCTINDGVISGTEADKRVLPYVVLRAQMRMMIPMVKSILYLVYYHNDEKLESYLISQIDDTSKLNFFHSNSEVGKIINKNCINILNYVRHSKKSLENDNADVCTNKTILMRSNTIQKSTTDLKGKNMANYDNLRMITEMRDKVKEEIERLTRKILVYATNITSIAINYPDYYLTGFRRLLDRNKEIYLNYIQKDQMTLSTSEKNFIEQIKVVREELEETYFNYFKFEAKEDLIVETALSSIRSFYRVAGVSYSHHHGEVLPITEFMHNEMFNRINRDKDNEVNYILSSQNKDDEKVKKIVPKSKTIHNLDSSRPFINQKGDLVSKDSAASKETKEFKYRILLNKTLLIPSLIKSIKIIIQAKECQFEKEDKEYNSFEIDDELLDELVKLIYFYIDESPDNCMMIFTADILTTFFLLDKNQIHSVIDLIHYALFTVTKYNIQMSSLTIMIRLLKKLLLKISGDPSFLFLLEKIIKIIKQLSEISFINLEYMTKKLREITVLIFEKNPILTDLKAYLIEYDHFADKKANNNSILNTYNNEVILKEESQRGEGEAKRMSTINAIDSIRKSGLTELNGYKIQTLIGIYIKFLKIVNFLFDGNATLNELPFLSKILNYNDMPLLLRKKNLDLNLRIEILTFFRMSTIDVIIDTTKLNEYRSLFVNQIHLPEEGGLFEDGFNYKFFNDLLFVNENSVYLGLESSVLKYELRHFDLIVESSNCRDQATMLDYFQNGVILPLFVFLNKFMAIIYNLKGYEYLKLYEIVIYFLRLKKFLIENNQRFEKPVSFEFKSIFKSYTKEFIKKKLSMIYSKFSNQNLQEVTTDIEEMCKPHFEILNYRNVYGYFEKHVEGFIQKPKSKSLKKLFEKKESHYDEEKLKRMDNELKLMGLLKTNFERKIFDAIVKYENDKNKFQESAFVQNLGEQMIQLDSNYRAIILKTVFFLVNDNKLAEKYKKQNFWHLFKLLQYDTVPTQTEIYSLYEDNKSFINLPHIVNLFLENLLSLIFAACNPSATTMNEDYYLAINIIKILKYLCEEHNIHFQTIFFKELKFDCIFSIKSNMSDKLLLNKGCISLFDLLLGVITKVIVLSKWEKVKFETDENSITYFYDIFFVITELLIEMVQGTSEENLENILHADNEDMLPFNSFLHNVKNLLLRDKNDSVIVYRVRKDIVDFIVAFLEEKATPKKLISMISSVYNPYTIFETIVSNMKKLYLKKIHPNEPHKVQEYINDIFDYKKCQFFVSTYFSDLEFCQTPEFEFSNRLYQYVKLLASQFFNEDAINIIESINSIEEQQLIDLYVKKLYKKGDFNDITHGEIVLDDTYVQNYFAVKFFEKITRSVTVQKDGYQVTVLFTLNPLVPFLSKSTKHVFYENVNRESRYMKLFSLMEYSDYFFDEIIYNASKLQDSWFLRMLNHIDYYIAESVLFLFILIKNIIMLANLDTHEMDYDFPNTYTPIKVIAIIEVVLNSVFIISWFISKFSLYYTIEKKKYSVKWKISAENLGVLDKAAIVMYNTIIQKNEINGFIWNIILSAVGLSAPHNTFLFSIQLLIIINLSNTLKNIIKSVTLRYKQLLTTWMFVIIMLYVFSNFAFFFLSEDFIITLAASHRLRMLSSAATVSTGDPNSLTVTTAGNQENMCGSLLNCFLTHLDYGLRTDGGMGEHLKKISFHDGAGYYIGRFFYELLFFIVMIVILFSIVFGIIIDTFAELGEESHKIENDKHNKCFICGAKREDLEKNCVNYHQHVSTDHNIWTYVEYIIGLKFVDPQETNAVNSHVIEMIEQKSISWFPSAHADKEEKHE